MKRDNDFKFINANDLQHVKKNFVYTQNLIDELKKMSHRYDYPEKDTEMFSIGYRQALRDVLRMVEEDENGICIDGSEALAFDLMGLMKKAETKTIMEGE